MPRYITQRLMMSILFTVLMLGGCSGGGSDDTIFLSVVNVSPTDGANEIDEQAILTATFNTEVDETTVNSASFRLSLDGTALAGTVESSGSIAVFTPAVALQQGRLYNAVITTDVHDLDGNALAADYHWSFSTQGDQDLTPPTIILTDPQNGHQVPYLTAQVSAYFSEEMDAVTINTDTFTLENPRGKVPGSVNYSANKATLDITDQRLDLNSRYTATITNFAKDSNGLRMANTHQWEFITLDGSWQGAALIESGTGDPYNPQIAVDGNGNAIAVWHQYDGLHSNIYANRFDASSGSWQGEALIESGTGSAYDPQIAVDGSGNAIAVWCQDDGSDYSIYANHFDASSDSWQGAALIKSGTGDAYVPQITVDGSGNAIAVWRQFDGSYDSIYANHFDASSDSWQGAALIESGTGSADYPQVTIDSGNAMAVWRQYNGLHNDIYANRFDASSGSWQGAALIESGTGDTFSPQIAVDGSGNAIAVWCQDDGSYNSIYANRFDASSGSWQGEALIESGTGSAYDPQIAVDGSGNAMAVWRQYNSSAYDIYANRFDVSSGSWQGVALIESGTNNVNSSQITIDSSGNAITVWRQYDGSYDSIYANRFDARSGSWQGAALIESGTGDTFSPQIAVGGNGNAIAVWYQDDGSYHSVYTNRFE